ncbi:alpha/beta hydrolase [Nocardia sp. MDA0666]|uniref:RBBP9/YdeN family alpha/beta hydrolase n=1 Tax=Nocardia sp. MDA0666 TaxID=2135448 RepID=UPI001E617DE5|nr:alpha/beta hydrolase [Nocardia sp. MDA0666]
MTRAPLSDSTEPALVIVPGLDDQPSNHWLRTLAAGPHARTVPRPPVGTHLDREAWVANLSDVVSTLSGEIVLTAHGAGVLTIAHWAQRSNRPIRAALLVTPPDFEHPPGDDSRLRRLGSTHGWCPIPRSTLPFPTILATSTNDPYASHRRVTGLAESWGSRPMELGPVGHLDPTAGYGPWPRAAQLLNELISPTRHSAVMHHR